MTEYFLLAIAIIAIIYFWASQFLDLMEKEDDDFPGKHDKILWFTTLILGSAFGALLFYISKLRRATPCRRPFKFDNDPNIDIKLQSIVNEYALDKDEEI